MIGAYTKQTAQPPMPYTGYVSTLNHDFGSMLNFIEYAFGLGGPYGISGQQNWPYADYFAPEVQQGTAPYGLADFFNFSQNNFHAFTPIVPLHYQPICFHDPGYQGCFQTYPLDPDNDANQSD